MKMFFTKARIFVTVLGYALRMQRTSLKPSSIDLTGWTTSDLFGGDSPQPPAVYVVIDVATGEPLRGFLLDPFRDGFDGFDFDPDHHRIAVYRLKKWLPVPGEGARA